MPTPTYTPLANITLGSSAASVTFSSISQGFRDLVLVVNAQAATGSSESYAILRFNSDTGSNYSRVIAFGTGSAAQSFSGSNLLPITTPLNSTGVRGLSVMNIMDYTATDKHKTVLYRDDNPSVSTVMGAGRWANTAAITTVACVHFSDTFASGSTFALYGIAA